MSKSDDTGSVLYAVFHVIFIVLMFGGFSEYFIEIYVGLAVLLFAIIYFMKE